jgi:hypothetical protein
MKRKRRSRKNFRRYDCLQMIMTSVNFIFYEEFYLLEYIAVCCGESQLMSWRTFIGPYGVISQRNSS